jgi:hypothetical protein
MNGRMECGDRAYERPYRAAQLRFTDADGMRLTCLAVNFLHEPLRRFWPWVPAIKELDLYKKVTSPEPAAAAGVPAPKHGLVRRVPTGFVVAFVAMLGFSLIGIGTASAASPAAPAGGHAAARTNSGGGSGGGGGGTWNQTKVPLPHLPGQAPVFDRNLQSATVADVVALDQTSEPAADASMIAFYQNNTACTVDTNGKPNVQDTITCPNGTATTTDALDGSTWVHVFRLVK